MAFYTGRSADGWDTREFRGCYTNPDNPNEFSNVPYTEEEKMEEKKWKHETDLQGVIFSYMGNEKDIRDVYNEILEKKCKLSKRYRDYIIKIFKE